MMLPRYKNYPFAGRTQGILFLLGALKFVDIALNRFQKGQFGINSCRVDAVCQTQKQAYAKQQTYEFLHNRSFRSIINHPVL